MSDWFERLNENVVLNVRGYLRTICMADFPGCSDKLDLSNAWTCLVNARIVPSQSNFDRLDSVLNGFQATDSTKNHCKAVDQCGDWVVAIVPTDHVNEVLLHGDIEIDDGNEGCLLLESLRLPHDVIQFNQKYFNENLNSKVADGVFAEIADGVFVAEGAEVHSDITANTVNGPVLIAGGAKVGPYCYFEGPVFVGPSCKVLEHSSIKDYVCLTDTVKAGGEIEASVIEPYSNKQHHGFLGHSYLGSWINVGAGTCNSDLKNTYGKVNVRYGTDKFSTELQFIGCFMGDYSKTAINTSIFTGKTIGVCSMLYGFVAENVPSFVNYAKTFGQETLVPADVMIKTQHRMFGRRKLTPRPVDVELIKSMYALTESERKGKTLQNSPPSF